MVSAKGYFVLFLTIAFVHVSFAHNLQIDVQASWPTPSVVLEASEYIAQWCSSEEFWQFAELITKSLTERDVGGTDRDIYDAVITVARTITSDDNVRMLSYALSAHIMAPSVEMYRQLSSAMLEVHEDARGLDAFAVIDGQLITTLAGLRSALANISPGNVTLYEFDHILHKEHASRGTVLLYANIGTSAFLAMHELLAAAEVQYVLRYVAQAEGSHAHMPLQGYGVELSLKRTDYIAVDDTKAENAHEGRATIAADDSDEALLTSSLPVEPLKSTELKNLPVQLVQRVLSASDPIRLLRDIMNNFPSAAPILTDVAVNDSLREQLLGFAQYFSMGDSALYLNARELNMRSIDPFRLFVDVQSERRMLGKFEQLQISSDTLQSLLAECSMSSGATLRYDVRSPAVVFLNNLEKDAMYSRWPKTLNELNTQAGWPGQMKFIAKNIFTVVFVADPASEIGNRMLGTLVHHMYQSAPIRLGVVLDTTRCLKEGKFEKTTSLVPEHIAVYMARIFTFFAQQDQRLGNGWLQLAFVMRPMLDNMGNRAPLSLDTLRTAFDRLISNASKRKRFEAVALDESLDEVYINGWNEFVESKGLLRRTPALFVNGIMSDAQSERFLFATTAQETNHIRTLLNEGKINDRTVVYDYLLADAADRYSELVIPSEDHLLAYVDLSSSPLRWSKEDTRAWNELSMSERKQRVITQLSYLHAPGTADNLKAVSHWLTCDVDTPECAATLRAASFAVAASSRDRVTLLHTGASSSVAALVLNAAMSLYAPSDKQLQYVRAVTDAVAEGEPLPLEKAMNLAEEIGLGKFSSRLQKHRASLVQQLEDHAAFASSVLHVTSQERVVISNGRILRLPEGTEMSNSDWLVLGSHEYSTRCSCAVSALEDAEFPSVEVDDLTSDFRADVVLMASSLLGEFSDLLQGRSQVTMPDESNYHYEGDPALQVQAVINPVSANARKSVALLLLLRDVYNATISLYFSLPFEVSEMPIKSYFRYVLASNITFDAAGRRVNDATAIFSRLPVETLLTTHLVTPHSWLVETIDAVHDLDNIMLASEQETVYALVELKHILVEGHCSEWPTMQPPRGLELILGTQSNPHMEDTLVMANLGYFQLKAAPGVWQLQLAEGRASDLYSIPNGAMDIIVTDYLGTRFGLKVTKRPGHEHEQLLSVPTDQAEDNSATMWDKFKSLWGSGSQEAKKEAPVVATNETVHVFSIASGHLYERFLKIMMLSVTKTTPAPVKFWFISNWLSPGFKKFLPHMADRYGFEYQLIEYKWPDWLHAQTEKQRVIWGYKILFLDVIFPLDLKKVIFIDADQVIRSDLRELYNMDMQGAPLAFTPFCDSNREMEGFRFWKQGFWQEHLHGKPYHISALFVVDLQKFRRMGGGDQFRMYYEQLSRDPNSLANLDQDLPNYAQHLVPIFSLPQEWLWCETWCDADSKTRAKTIDLCNNPLTKRPKLDAAKEIIAEWPSLDEEVKSLERELAEKYKQNVEVDPITVSASINVVPEHQ